MYPFWSLLLLAALPYTLTAVTMYHRKKQLGFLDHRHPQSQARLLDGAGARSFAAQRISWEFLALYAIAFLAAVAAGVAPDKTLFPAVTVVLSQVFHAVFYIMGIPLARTISFIISLTGCLWLLKLAAFV